jgi:hypothetical protein
MLRAAAATAAKQIHAICHLPEAYAVSTQAMNSKCIAYSRCGQRGNGFTAVAGLCMHEPLPRSLLL